MKAEVGKVVAKVGAWNRKYLITKVYELEANPEDSFSKTLIIELTPLGDYYADGRCIPSRRAKPREVKSWGHVAHDVQLWHYAEDQRLSAAFAAMKS